MVFRVGEWNSIVVGAWNPAVLTPNGIRQHLLRLGREAPLFIEVNVEQAQPPRVRHEGLIIVVGIESLVVGPELPTLPNLRRAVETLRGALDTLNQTPVRAAGINFRYVEDDPTALLDMRRCPLDEPLEQRFAIVGRVLKRTITMAPGVVNLEIREENAQLFADLNFHLDSAVHHELSAWLDRLEEFHREGANLLELLGVQLGEQA